MFVYNEVEFVKLVSWTCSTWLRFALQQFKLKQQQLRPKDGNGKYSCRDSDVEFPVSGAWSWKARKVAQRQQEDGTELGSIRTGCRACPGANLAVVELEYMVGTVFRSFRSVVPFAAGSKTGHDWLKFDLAEDQM